MSSFEDLQEARAMERPEPPRCPKCRSLLEMVSDRVSGKPVRQGGRALHRCPECGELVIGADYRSHRRRYRVVAVLVGIAAFCGLASEIAFGIIRQHQNLQFDVLFVAKLVLAAGIAMCASVVAESIAVVISPGKLGGRFQMLILALYWSGFGTLMGWCLYMLITTVKP